MFKDRIGNETDRLNYKITIMSHGNKKRGFVKESCKGHEDK